MACLMPLAAWAEQGCTGDEPLIDTQWEAVPFGGCGVATGPWEWPLPISFDHPDLLTAARVQVSVSKPSAFTNWKAKVHFTFNDPKPYGIPFTFQKMKLFFQTIKGESSVEVDWSRQCEDVGRGMFPGQSFTASVDLPDTQDVCAFAGGELRVWGGRN